MSLNLLVCYSRPYLWVCVRGSRSTGALFPVQCSMDCVYGYDFVFIIWRKWLIRLHWNVRAEKCFPDSCENIRFMSRWIWRVRFFIIRIHIIFGELVEGKKWHSHTLPDSDWYIVYACHPINIIFVVLISCRENCSVKVANFRLMRNIPKYGITKISSCTGQNNIQFLVIFSTVYDQFFFAISSLQSTFFISLMLMKFTKSVSSLRSTINIAGVMLSNVWNINKFESLFIASASRRLFFLLCVGILPILPHTRVQK